jgi:hypothetical protein
VRTAIAGASHFFGGSVEASETGIELASVVVPVFAPGAEEPANSGLVLRLCHLPAAVDGATVQEWVRAMQDAAAEVTEALRTSARKDYARYAAAGLRYA